MLLHGSFSPETGITSIVYAVIVLTSSLLFKGELNWDRNLFPQQLFSHAPTATKSRKHLIVQRHFHSKQKKSSKMNSSHFITCAFQLFQLTFSILVPNLNFQTTEQKAPGFQFSTTIKGQTTKGATARERTTHEQNRNLTYIDKASTKCYLHGSKRSTPLEPDT